MKASKTAAKQKSVRLPRNDAKSIADYHRKRLDREFPKVDLRELIGDDLAEALLCHAQSISMSMNKPTYEACAKFVARQAIAVEMEGMKSDNSNLIGSTLEWDRHVRGLKKGGAL